MRRLIALSILTLGLAVPVGADSVKPHNLNEAPKEARPAASFKWGGKPAQPLSQERLKASYAKSTKGEKEHTNVPIPHKWGGKEATPLSQQLLRQKTLDKAPFNRHLLDTVPGYRWGMRHMPPAVDATPEAYDPYPELMTHYNNIQLTPPIAPTLNQGYRSLLAEKAPFVLKRIDYRQPLMLDDIHQLIALRLPEEQIINVLIQTCTYYPLTTQDDNQLEVWGFSERVVERLRN